MFGSASLFFKMIRFSRWMYASIDPMSVSLSLPDAVHDFAADMIASANNGPTTGRQLWDRCLRARIGLVIRTPSERDKTEGCNCPQLQLHRFSLTDCCRAPNEE